MSTITETPDLTFSLPAPKEGIYLGLDRNVMDERMAPHFESMRAAVEKVCHEAGISMHSFGKLTGIVRFTGDTEQLQIAQSLLEQRNLFAGLVTKSVFNPEAAVDF